MITVKIDEDELLSMLMNRVEHWTDDRDTLELFEKFYENRIDGGCFDGAELDIMSIVDNDYVNNTSIVTIDEYNKERNEFLRDQIQRFIEENKNQYDDDEQEDYREALKDFIADKLEEAPEFDDLEVGENNLDYLGGYYIEAKTENSLLISW